MRFLVKATAPHEPFNTYVKDGSIAKRMQQVLGELKPEAVYLMEIDGKRTAILIVNMDKASQIPSVAEPWFLQFNADVEFHPVMSPEDLGNAGLEALGKKWG
jgi:hypothetical protein